MPASNNDTDFDLLRSMKQDDLHAFDLLYDRYWSLLYNTAYKKLKDSEPAKDIVQDIFLDIWQRRAVLEINNLPAYLKTAVNFRVINYVTRNRSGSFYDLFDEIARSPYEPDLILAEKELLKLVEAWMEALPEKRKQIFIRHFFDNISTRNIAGELGLSQNTVQNQLASSLRSLRLRFAHLLTSLFW